MAEPFDPTPVFQAVDLGGVLANGVLGGVLARRLGFDAVGFVVLALISGLGGGMLRDTLLQMGAPVALTNPAYLACALLGALIAFLVDVRIGPISSAHVVMKEWTSLSAGYVQSTGGQSQYHHSWAILPSSKR